MASSPSRQPYVRGAHRQEAARRRVGPRPELHLGEVTVPTMVSGQSIGLEQGKPVTGEYATYWKEAGVALAIPVAEHDRKGVHARSEAEYVVRTEELGRFAEGTLIALYHGEEPGPENQHLRIVQSVKRGKNYFGREIERVTLGPALTPVEVPAPLNRKISLTSVHVNILDDNLQVMSGDRRVLGTVKQVDFGFERDSQIRAINSLIQQAERAGGRDRRRGKQDEYTITAATHDGRPYWQIADQKGHFIELTERSVTDRRPPPGFQNLLAIARTAYEEGWEAAPPMRMPAPMAVTKPIIEIQQDFVPTEAPALRM